MVPRDWDKKEGENHEYIRVYMYIHTVCDSQRSQRRGWKMKNGLENAYAVAESWKQAVVAGINTAFNVGRRRSWAWGPGAASFLLHPLSSAVLQQRSRSLSCCHRPGPEASTTTTRIVIVTEIADPKDSHRHQRPPFSLLSPSTPTPPCSRVLGYLLLRVRPSSIFIEHQDTVPSSSP